MAYLLIQVTLYIFGLASNQFRYVIDELEYGGKFEDLRASVKSLRAIKPENTPPCIVKDIIIHPVQIAQALQEGAAGVLLIVAVVGADLEVLLDACTIMGTEPIVEVHTPNELEFALSKGATIFLVNMWDRMTGELHPNQAKGLASMLPMNSLAIASGNIHNIDQVSFKAIFWRELQNKSSSVFLGGRIRILWI